MPPEIDTYDMLRYVAQREDPQDALYTLAEAYEDEARDITLQAGRNMEAEERQAVQEMRRISRRLKSIIRM